MKFGQTVLVLFALANLADAANSKNLRESKHVAERGRSLISEEDFDSDSHDEGAGDSKHRGIIDHCTGAVCGK